MATSSISKRQRGFALVELAAVAIIIAVVSVLLCLGSADARRRARLGDSLSNLKHFALGTTGYGADNNNRVWTFSWRHGIDYGFGGVAATDMQAAANQGVDIMRRRGGRTDIQPIAGWFPYTGYSHLILEDYLEQTLPTLVAVSPGDRLRLAWANTHNGAEYFAIVSRPPGSSNAEMRWPFSSSYELGPCFSAPDALINGFYTFEQGSSGHRSFSTGSPDLPIGMRRMDEVTFPSHKAMFYEQNQRFYGQRQPYFMYTEARIPVLFADGSASVRSTVNCNLGFRPNSPTSMLTTSVLYNPDLNWETPTQNGGSQEYVTGHLRWTRSGMRGRDFGGPEVPWTP